MTIDPTTIEFDPKAHTLKCHEIAADALNEIAALEEMGNRAADDSTIETSEVAKMLFDVIAAHAALDRAAKRLYHVKDKLEKHTMPTRMDAMGVDMIRVPEIARSFSRQPKMSASFVDKEKGFQWLRDIGMGDVIQETVNAGTLTAFVRNMMLEEGIDPPEDVVKVSQYYSTGINKYTPK